MRCTLNSDSVHTPRTPCDGLFSLSFLLFFLFFFPFSFGKESHVSEHVFDKQGRRDFAIRNGRGHTTLFFGTARVLGQRKQNIMAELRDVQPYQPLVWRTC